MKRQTLFFAVIILFLCISCNKIDQLTHFYLEYNESVSVPEVPDLGLAEGSEIPDVETNLEIKIPVNNTHTETIEEVLLEEVSLSMDTPEGADFSFMKSIAIYMSGEGIDEIKAAWLDSIPSDCGDSISLETTTDDLKNFIALDSLTLRINTVIQKVITSDYKIDLYSKFFVDAEILGQ